MRWRAAALVFVGLIVLAVGARGFAVLHAQGSCAVTGWQVLGDACLSPNPAGDPGSHLPPIEITVPGGSGTTTTIRSQYWLLPVEAGATYSFTLLASGVAPGVSFEVGLGWRDVQGSPLDEVSIPTADHGQAQRHFAFTDLPAPPGSEYAGVALHVPHHDPEVAFTLDTIMLTKTADPPSTPTPTATATASPSLTPTPTPTPTPTATGTPAPGPVLINPAFREGEDGLLGWQVVSGNATAGGGLLLEATGSATAYVQQVVTVTPGEWYLAGAVLTPRAGVEAGWVRIAWYTSTDGSGAQTGVADSPLVPPAGLVSAGPVQAPPDARSARVRLLLRPLAPGAMMAVDEAFFGLTAPPPPTPTPTPSPTPTPQPTATTAPVTPTTPAESAATATATPDAGVSGASTAGSASGAASGAPRAAPSAPSPGRTDAELAALAGAQRWLRMTELLPNAEQPGIDADYEWVEITNIGPVLVSTEGMELHDNHGGVSLEPHLLLPGTSLVVAAPLAEVGAAPLVQFVEVIGNGLSNSGDHLVLFAANGQPVDALSYGSDTTYERPGHPIAAPAPGHSIVRRFASDGALVEVAHEEEPRAGFAEIALAGVTDPVESTPVPDAGDAPRVVVQDGAEEPGEEADALAPVVSAPIHRSMWAVLILLAAGVLGGVATHRAITIARAGRAVEAEAPAEHAGGGGAEEGSSSA